MKREGRGEGRGRCRPIARGQPRENRASAYKPPYRCAVGGDEFYPASKKKEGGESARAAKGEPLDRSLLGKSNLRLKERKEKSSRRSSSISSDNQLSHIIHFSASGKPPEFEKKKRFSSIAPKKKRMTSGSRRAPDFRCEKKEEPLLIPRGDRWKRERREAAGVQSPRS